MRRAVCFAAVVGALLLAAPAASASVISWSGVPEGDAYWFRPVGIAFGVDGNLFVSDTDLVGTSWVPHPRVVRFDPDGNYLSQWNITYGPGAVATDSGGNPYVVTGKEVRKHTPSGAPGTPPAFGTCPPPPPYDCDVSAVAVDGAGNVYVGRSWQQRVDEYDPSGTLIHHWSLPFGVTGLAVSPGDDVYVALYDGGRIYKLGPADDQYTTVFDTPFPGNLAVDAADNFYVVAGVGVIKFDSAGTLLGSWDVPHAVGIVLDDSGRVYVTAPAHNPSQPDGGFVSRLDPRDEHAIPALTASSGAPFASQLVTFDASGSLPPKLGSITGFRWDLDGNGTFETDGGLTPTISRRFPSVAAETVRVRVSGSTGITASKAITVHVKKPPTVITAAPAVALTGETVAFDASGSAIPLSQVEGYRWDLDGDGNFETDTGTSPTVSRSYGSRGTRKVSVRVPRSGGRVDVASVNVDVRLAPPPGELGVSINDGAFATNDRNVTLTLAWPRLSESALVSNDGGFGTAGSTALLPVDREIAWTLRSGGADRLPKTVYLRYRGGAAGAETYTDDIVLDEGAPAVTSARAAHRVLRVKARDDNTGIRTIVVKRPGARRPFKTVTLATPTTQAKRRVTAAVKLPRGVRRAYARVIDVAGNRSRLRRVSFR